MTWQVIERARRNAAPSPARTDPTKTMRASSASLNCFLLAAAVMLVNTPARATPPPDASAKSMPTGTQNPDATEDAVGRENRAIAKLAGHWNVRQSFWSPSKATPAIEHGTAVFTPVLGGRHLRQELRIESPTKPFEGLGYMGFDNAAGIYYSSWRDTNFTGVITATGSYDAASKIYTFTGKMADPQDKGNSIPLREVLRIVDADHFVYQYYETHQQKEALAVELDYARAQ